MAEDSAWDPGPGRPSSPSVLLGGTPVRGGGLGVAVCTEQRMSANDGCVVPRARGDLVGVVPEGSEGFKGRWELTVGGVFHT